MIQPLLDGDMPCGFRRAGFPGLPAPEAGAVEERFPTVPAPF